MTIQPGELVDMSLIHGIPALAAPMMPRRKRALDIVTSALLIILFSPLLVAVALAVKFTSRGPILHWSNRVGQGNRIFLMPKFRSMCVGTPLLATHLLSDPARYLTPIGAFLRKTSLDELPQLFSVVAGDLSLVGPRPALYNQHDLIELRTQNGVDVLVPGITGWAQINGRDELPIPIKVAFDREYLQRRSFVFDLKILLMTPRKVALSEGVSHQGIGATSDRRKILRHRTIQFGKQSKALVSSRGPE
jgi:O-antigen biosynthesis protein WbqP